MPTSPRAGAKALVNFLVYAGLPLLALRQGIRSNDYHIISKMWMYMLNPFRASNKTNYDRLCVMMTHTFYRLKPELQEIYRSMCTASLRGHVGRNVGWDFTLERMNLEVQTVLGNSITRERIQDTIRQLNGIRHIRAHLLDAFGLNEPAEFQ